MYQLFLQTAIKNWVVGKREGPGTQAGRNLYLGFTLNTKVLETSQPI